MYSNSIYLCRTPRLPWSFKFKVEVSFPLSSFRTTSYTPASFLEIWQRAGKPDSAVKTTTDEQYDFYIHLKRQAFSSSKGAAETHIWRKSKKSRRTNNRSIKTKAFSGKTAKPEVAVGWWWQQKTVTRLLGFSRLRCWRSLLCLLGSRAEMGHMWHHVYIPWVRLPERTLCHWKPHGQMFGDNTGEWMSFETQNGKEG